MTFSQVTHPGNMPIRVLQNNVIHHFENIRAGVLERHIECIKRDKISPGIIWVIEKETVRTPYCNCENKSIVVQEVYQSYIWAITYSLWVIFEEAIEKKMVAGKWKGIVELDTLVLQNAEKLFNWALTLTERYSDWDTSLPNPECHKADEERFYAEKVNGIFLDIIVYNLFHECCHLINNHCEFIEKIRYKGPNELTNEERNKHKALENEADLFALETIIASSDADHHKLVKGLSIILANISNLFILRHPRMVQQITHPDVDTRLHNVLEYLGQDLPLFDYVWLLACFACRVFFTFHNIPVKSMPADNSIQLFYRYLKIFDSIKEKAKRPSMKL